MPWGRLSSIKKLCCSILVHKSKVISPSGLRYDFRCIKEAACKRVKDKVQERSVPYRYEFRVWTHNQRLLV